MKEIAENVVTSLTKRVFFASLAGSSLVVFVAKLLISAPYA